MNKKCLVLAICLGAICIFTFLFIVNKHSKNVRLNLNKNEVQQIDISFSMPLFDKFYITDTKQVNRVIDYLNLLNKKETKKDPGEYAGGGYTIKIYLNNGIERTLSLSGNMFFAEKNRFTYEIPYKEAIKFDTIVASILEGNQSKKGESSIIGTIISGEVQPGGGGGDISCVIKAEGNSTYNIELKDTKIIDATGGGNLFLHKTNKIKVFYLKSVQTDNGIIHASMVFIESSTR